MQQNSVYDNETIICRVRTMKQQSLKIIGYLNSLGGPQLEFRSSNSLLAGEYKVKFYKTLRSLFLYKTVTESHGCKFL